MRSASALAAAAAARLLSKACSASARVESSGGVAGSLDTEEAVGSSLDTAADVSWTTLVGALSGPLSIRPRAPFENARARSILSDEEEPADAVSALALPERLSQNERPDDTFFDEPANEKKIAWVRACI